VRLSHKVSLLPGLFFYLGCGVWCLGIRVQGLLSNGYRAIAASLAQGLDVRLSHKVGLLPGLIFLRTLVYSVLYDSE